MPNPFIKAGPANTSRNAGTDREPLEPVPEEYVGDNNPYRGIESHGVTPTFRPAPTTGYSETLDVEYEEPVTGPEPVPVQIIQSGPRFRRIFRADGHQYNYDHFNGKPFMLLPREEHRTRVQIISTNGLWEFYIGHSDQMKDWIGGYPLSGGRDVIIQSTEPIWALIADVAATNMRIAYIAEYEIPRYDD